MTADILPPGTMVGRYRIEQPLATGGPDGPAYRAHDAASARRVMLLEFLPPGIARRRPDAATEDAAHGVEPLDQDFRPLFAAGVAEVQALAVDFSNFRHPNVLPLLDCFAANATVYLAVETADGRTLDRLLGPSEALAPEEVQEILPSLFAGADAIHKAGLLHLDICPAAVAIRRDGTAALGRAHLVRRTLGAPDRGAVLSARDAYRAEEYFQPNGKLGPWTDIYALSATLFRLATGKAPPDPVRRRREIASGQPDPVAVALDAITGAWPAQFVVALRHGLAIPPHNRPQNVSALRAAFGAATPGEIPTLPLRDPAGFGPAASAGDERTKPLFPMRAPEEAKTVRTRDPARDAGPVPRRAQAPDPETPTVRMESQRAPRPGEGVRADPDATKPIFPPRPAKQFSGPANPDDIATIRMGRERGSASAPILKPPPLPEPPGGEEKKTTVIYRRGKAQVVTAPPRDPSGPPPAAAPASDAEATILPARFSVFQPMLMQPGQWLDLAVYLHEPGIDSFVRQDHMARYEGKPGETPERRSPLRYTLKPGAAVTVIPHLPGCRINPPRATVEWWENFHRIQFRVMANPGAPGYAEGQGAGVIQFFVGPLLVGEQRLAFTVGRERAHPISNTASLAADTFDAVFPAYAPQDGEIADRFAAVGTQIDSPFLAEILEMRGREWEREILKRIEAAERFQLFWSAAASRSPHLEEEWRFALALARERFIRAVYWRHPAPGLPRALDEVETELRYLVLTLE
jgi:serine/threonine protein kinase